MEFSRQLSLLMERNNTSDSVLAKYVGVSRQSVMGWKKGSIPTVDKLQKIAEFFEIPVSIFGYSFSDIKPTDAFWIKMDGTALTAFGAKEVLRRLCAQAGIEPQSFHDFRRFYALELYKATRDVFFVSRALDHKSVEVTKRYLALDVADDLEEARAVSPMDRALHQTGIKVNRARVYA